MKEHSDNSEDMHDRIERLGAEEALRESEARYRLLFENAIEGIFQTTFDGRLIMVNKALAHMLGYSSPQEAIEKITDLGSQVYANQATRKSLVERLLRDGFVTGSEVAFKKRDGTPITVLLHFHLVRDKNGKPEHIEGSCFDITDRLRAEEALKTSEEKYRQLHNAMMDAFASVSMDGRIQECNEVYLTMLGYEDAEIKRLTYMDFTPEKWHAFEARIVEKQVLAKGYSDTYEKEYRRKNGTVFPVELRTYLLRDNEGRPSGMWAIIRDITERKEAEDRLKEANRRLSNIIEFLPDATLITDADGRIIAWNRALEEMTGVAKKDIIGRNHEEAMVSFYGKPGPFLIDFIGRNDKDILSRYSGIRHKRDTINAEVFTPALYQGKGAHIWATASPLYDGAGHWIGAIECIRDSTDKHQAEDALKESEARYRLLAENASDIIFTINLDLHLTYVSPSVERIRGYTVQEALSQSLGDILVTDSLEKARKAFEEVLAMEADGPKDLWRKWTLELEEFCKDGSTIWTETTVTSLRDEEKRLTGFLGITRDITERKNAADENARLETRLVQAQKMEAIGTLAGGIAHDFNNILAAIFGYSELAMENAADAEKVRHHLQSVLKAGERAKDLVSQILTFSRKTEITYSPMALRTVVKESLKMMRSVIPTTIEIRQHMAASGLVLSAPTQIQQIIMNLCTNAAHAMEETGGILEVDLLQEQLDQQRAADLDVNPGSYLKLTVKDTGRGMTPQVMERIFEPYFTTKELGRGTGLGLSVVHGIVKSHNGAISCRSAMGEGTTFDVYLPEIEQERHDDKPLVRQPLPTGTERILFVDDETALTDLADRMLTTLGYTVTVKNGSVEALDAFKKNPAAFDLVITDMTMPVMTGEKLARHIMEVRSDIPIILCTGYSDSISEEKAHILGIRAFLFKPIVMLQLAGTIRKVLDTR